MRRGRGQERTAEVHAEHEAARAAADEEAAADAAQVEAPSRLWRRRRWPPARFQTESPGSDQDAPEVIARTGPADNEPEWPGMTEADEFVDRIDSMATDLEERFIPGEEAFREGDVFEGAGEAARFLGQTPASATRRRPDLRRGQRGRSPPADQRSPRETSEARPRETNTGDFA
jgi:hypothetical protein